MLIMYIRRIVSDKGFLNNHLQNKCVWLISCFEYITSNKSPEVGVFLPSWWGNNKQAHKQSSHPIWVILGVLSPGTKTNKQSSYKEQLE